MTVRALTDGEPEAREAREPERPERARWMAVLAKSPAARVAALFESLGARPAYRRVRGPEAGLVQVRARAGGEGQRFNLGDMTVTRCVVQLEGGATGHAIVAGRDHGHAEAAAVLDGMLQDPARGPELRRTVIGPLEAELEARRRRARARTEATRVDFRTLVRGED